MKSDAVNLGDLSGGLNEAEAPTAIRDNQLISGVNFDLVESRLVRRRGIARSFTKPRTGTPGKCTATAVLGLRFFDTGILLLACAEGFAIGSGNETIDLGSDVPVAPSPNIMSNNEPWQTVGSNGLIWAARHSSGKLWRINEANAAVGGITAPSGVPTLANGGAGLVGAGTYGYIVTFVTDKGDESVATDEVSITLAGASEVDLTAIPVSAQARVVSKNIYRTLPNDAGTWWLVDTIDAGDVAYTDNVANSQLRDQYDSEIVGVPASVLGIEKWGERLWTHDGVEVSCSLPGQFETFGESFDSFDARGGRRVTTLHAWDTRIIVATNKALWQITESGVDDVGVRFSVNEFSTDHGCVAPNSMRSAEGRLFWVAADGVYMSDGGAPRKISEAVRKTFAQQATADWIFYSYAYIDADEGEYCLTVGRPSSYQRGRQDWPNIQLVYSWRKDAWSTRALCDDSYDNGVERRPVAPYAYVELGAEKMLAFGGYNAYSIQAESGADQGVSRWPVQARARLKQIAKPGAMMALRKVYLEIAGVENSEFVPAPAEDLTVKLYQDGNPVRVRFATVNIGEAPNRNIKRIGLGQKTSSYRPLCNSFGVEIFYEREPKISIASAMFDIDVYGVQGRSL